MFCFFTIKSTLLLYGHGKVHTLSLSHAVSPCSLFFQCFLSTYHGLSRYLFSMIFINKFWLSMDDQFVGCMNVFSQLILVVSGHPGHSQYEHLFSTNSGCQWTSTSWPGPMDSVSTYFRCPQMFPAQLLCCSYWQCHSSLFPVFRYLKACTG